MATIDIVLQKRHSSYQKYHLPKMAPNMNGISQLHIVFWSTTNTMLQQLPTPATITRRRTPKISFWSGKISTLKSHGHESELYNKFKNFLLKITQLSPRQI